MKHIALAAAIATAGCNQRYWVCEATDEERVAKLPARLSETGLYADTQSHEVAGDVLAYRVAFPLYSDGSDKRRWIRLPPGSRIDTRDMNDWLFPEGTRVWKEFSRDGRRLETRLLEKVGPGEDDWIGVSYVWDADQRDAVATPSGAIDVAGTSHDVPASGECMACHRGRKSRVLGFSAIQLSTDATPGEVDLTALGERGLLSDPPAGPLRAPGNETERAALGYLHANCSHCHNGARPSRSGARCFDPKTQTDFRLMVEDLASPQATLTYRTALGKSIEPRDPEGSRVVQLMSHRGMFRQMPPLGTEVVDREGVDLVSRWISEMR
jgi:hypothetical protein